MRGKDWTDKLPELLEGFTEAEPEGLWDAVQAGLAPRKRHVIAAWWYAGGALLAAAAISAVFFLWPSRRSVTPAVTVVPGDAVVADAPSSSSTTSFSGLSRESLPSAPESPAPVAKTPQNAPAEEPMEPLEEQKPTETLPEEAQVTPETTEQVPPSAKMPDFTDEPARTDKPARSERFRPSLKVQIGLSTTGYFGQTAMNTTTGVGLPANPGIRPDALPTTKSTAPGGTTQSSIPMMMSRNKVSTTDATHSQSARLALGIAIGITERWGVETGIVTSTLTSSFNTEAGSSYGYTNRTMKYLGIPLYARFNALQKGRLGLYLNAGPMYEFCTGINTDNSTYIGGKLTGHDVDNTKIEDIKWSLNAGGGVQLRVFKHGAIYVLPGVSYHIPSNSPVENFYTEHPLSASVTFGYNFVF